MSLSHRLRVRPLALGATVLLGASGALAASAHARSFPGEPIDGPTGGALRVGDLDVARDGGGGLVYLRQDGLATHVYLSRLVAGAWQPPERVDVGVESSATGASVSATDEGRLAIVFQSGPNGQDTYGVTVPGKGVRSLSSPALLHRAPAPGLGQPVPAPAPPAVDMGVNGRAYAVFRTPGSDIMAARMSDGWAGISQPLDVSRDSLADRPRVAVAADGNAVATWSEANRVYARRITGTTPSSNPQLVSLPSFGGAGGGNADHPDIDIEDDGSYAWVTWQQTFGGTSRALARRLVGSQFEPGAAVDGGGPGYNPAIDMTGRGGGMAVAGFGPSNGVAGAILQFDKFAATERIDTSGGAGVPLPTVAVGETEAALVAWRRDAGAVIGRYREGDSPLQGESSLTNPAFGSIASVELASGADRSGNAAVAFVQTDGGGRSRLVVASYDRLPGLPQPRSTTRWQRRTRPTLSWKAGRENWGPTLFRVLIDGRQVAQTARTRLRVPLKLGSGRHRWRAIAVDRRGQQRPMRRWRNLRIDVIKPRLRFQLSGKRRRGAGLRFRLRATDRGGSKLRRTTIVWGDGTRTSAQRGTKRFGRGTRRVRVYVYDNARNRTVKRLRVRIR